MRRALGIATLLAVVVSGCVVEVKFTPIGQDVSAEGMWTVNGATPDAAICSAAGINEVAVGFFDGSSMFFYDELSFPCSAGSFNTMPTKILAYGNYTTQWFAFDASGAVIGMGAMEPLVLAAPTGHTVLRPVDFRVGGSMFNPMGTDAQITGDWVIDGAAPDATNCAALGIDVVQIVLADEADTTFADDYAIGMADCEAGKFDSMPANIIRFGRYQSRYRALDASGGVVAESDPLLLVVQAPTTRAMLAQVNFVGATSLEALIGWDTNDDPMVMADADCATAGVVTMGHWLTDMGGATIQMVETEACMERIVFPDIAPGTYSLLLDGTNMAGQKLWMATCSMLIVESGIESYNCFVDKMPPPP